MVRKAPRLLLAASAVLCALGGALHAMVFFAKASSSIDGANLSPLLAAELKVLWLADSTTLMTLALLFGFIALKPCAVSRTVVVLLAVAPAATAVLLYLFLGPFYAGHMLIAASVMACVAGLSMPVENVPVAVAPQHQGQSA